MFLFTKLIIPISSHQVEVNQMQVNLSLFEEMSSAHYSLEKDNSTCLKF